MRPMAHDHAHEDHGHDRAGRAHDHHDHARDHGHDHGHDGHDHAHDPLELARRTPARKLKLALALTAGFMVVELAAGLLTHSLALLSDAGHMLTDSGALGLALVAQRIADRPRTRLFTFGFRRAEIVAALLNGVVLGVSAFWISVEAVRRLDAGPEIHGAPMFVVATLGLLVNLASAWVLGSGDRHNANTRAALAHVLSDAAGSVAAMVAGALVTWVGWRRADPIASFAISALILWGAWRLLRGSVEVLMETTPKGLDAAAIERTVRETPGVRGVHDLHVWSISDGFPIVTVHVVLDGTSHGTDVVRAVSRRLREAHQIEHATVQPEAPEEALVPVESIRRRG